MVTVPEAAAKLAEHAAEPELRLDQYARYLQNARLLPVASAPRTRMPQLDEDHLATLLIGCLASPTAIDAPKAVSEFGPLPAGPAYDLLADDSQPTGARRQRGQRPALAGGPAPRTFIPALASHIRQLADSAGNAAAAVTIVAIGTGRRAGIPFAFIDLRTRPGSGGRGGRVQRQPFGPRQGGGLQRVSQLPGVVVHDMARMLAAGSAGN